MTDGGEEVLFDKNIAEDALVVAIEDEDCRGGNGDPDSQTFA